MGSSSQGIYERDYPKAPSQALAPRMERTSTGLHVALLQQAIQARPTVLPEQASDLAPKNVDPKSLYGPLQVYSALDRFPAASPPFEFPFFSSTLPRHKLVKEEDQAL